MVKISKHEFCFCIRKEDDIDVLEFREVKGIDLDEYEYLGIKEEKFENGNIMMWDFFKRKDYARKTNEELRETYNIKKEEMK